MKPLNFEPYFDKEIGESKEEMEFEATEAPGDRKVRQARRDLRIAKKNRRQSRRWWPRWGWRRPSWRPPRRGPSTNCDLGSFLCCCLATAIVADAVTN